ncbi:uncharacterized protein LOC110189547 [Drosophila serrata]|uniref:uncharacterized protein LOC110189547 n=1 Tax=Drosophila serrata TaxID=7274 RepID=UPI000A1D283F|nr:uncharacterized protein LOC110189547 [Drosophila serrata]
MLSDDDNLGIYDDLDEFQQAEDHKSKELLAWEVKHRNALTEIEDLKARNIALEKKIRTMEVNLQNLLDTAKSEVKRKEVLIGQLRKEKDDICFRRKRGREVEEPVEKEAENKRLKAASKVDREVKKNPFRADLKIDSKSVGKRRSRSKSPRSRPKIQDHGSATRRKSRERRCSRSPRHSSRQEEHRSRGSNSRRRSRSPLHRAQVSESKSQKIQSFPGEDTKNGRDIGNKPHNEKTKKMIYEIATPLTPNELSSPEVATKKAQALTYECSDGDLQRNTPFESNTPTTEIIQNINAFVSKEERIPRLDICELAANNRESSDTTSQSKHPEIILDEILPQESVTCDPITVHMESKTGPISDNNAQTDEYRQVEGNVELDKPSIYTPIRSTSYEPTGPGDVEISAHNHLINKLTKNNSVVHAELKAELLVASGEAQRRDDINCSSAGNVPEPKNKSFDVEIDIIEDIRLPEVADIGHIAVIVNELCGGLEVQKKNVSDEQKNSSGRDGHCSDYNERNSSAIELKDPTTPSSNSNVLYAQPDSTKIDHNDTENEVILEAALNLLESSDLVPPAQSAPNLSLEEDAIEKALGQLHQTSSPDETVVTSTSNRARKTENHCAPTSTSLRNSPLHAKEAIIKEISTDMENTNDSQSQVSRVLELEAPPSPGQDITIDETVDDGCISNEEVSTVTKRCSLGHTDYQFEQRNDEIILRVKRRTRRRRSTPIEVEVLNPPPTGGKPD